MPEQRLRVLVVDDVVGVRESLRIALQEAGHEVATAEGGDEALKRLQAERFDVLVADVWMPQGDGLTLLRRIRTEQPELRVFAMTGGGPRMTIELASNLAEAWGAERSFVKPFDEALLVGAIAAPAEA